MNDYAKALGARLRAIRTQQGLSLHGVEEKSRGRWKAVVVGSYERGDRAVTVQRLAELAEFYGVPVGELLPDAAPSGASEPPPRLVIEWAAVGSCELTVNAAGVSLAQLMTAAYLIDCMAREARQGAITREAMAGLTVAPADLLAQLGALRHD